MKSKQTPKRKIPLLKPDYRRLANFRYILRRFMIFSEAAATAVKLTAQQHQALLAIKGFAGPRSMTAGALAKRLCVQPHSTVGLLDRLAANNLVCRRSAPTDRRQVVVELTPKAERVLK